MTLASGRSSKCPSNAHHLLDHLDRRTSWTTPSARIRHKVSIDAPAGIISKDSTPSQKALGMALARPPWIISTIAITTTALAARQRLPRSVEIVQQSADFVTARQLTRDLIVEASASFICEF